MIDKNVITKAVEEWLQKSDYYLVDVEMTADDRIVIEIDHADGVWIEDCADLSRHLQDTLGVTCRIRWVRNWAIMNWKLVRLASVSLSR